MTRYTVYHGTGNDFAVVDGDQRVPDRLDFGERLCARLGVDGVLFIDGDGDDPVRVRMTLVQPDRSTAAMCGNGARCAARWVAERADATEVVLETGAGDRRCVVDGETVTVKMGVPSFDPAAVPVDVEEPFVERELAGRRYTAVNTGVPHAVAFVDDVDAVDLEAAAPPIRHHEVFPEGANVNVAAPRGDGGFDQRTFERGVEGETRACGTGAVAVAAVAARLGRAPATGTVSVHPPGGELRVALDGPDGVATLRGPTERVGSGEATPEGEAP
ncbi:MAG: diaminopimelate epimerase [Halobacteriaceae archaeon]